MKLRLFLGFLLTFRLFADAPVKPTVFVEPIKLVKISDKLAYPAKIVPKTQAVVAADIDGVVEKIIVSIGTRVKKGQPLMMIKQTEPGYDFQAFTLRSPVNGVVHSIDISLGSRVNRGKNLVQIIDPLKYQILTEIPARDLNDLKVGQSGTLKLFGDEKTTAVKISGLSPVVDTVTNTSTAELLPLNKTDLRPGRLAQIEFEIRPHDGIELPEQAIVYQGKEPSVRVVDGGKAKYQFIKLGPFRNGRLEITQGLSEGQQVVIQSSQYVSEGESVDVQKKDAEPKKGS